MTKYAIGEVVIANGWPAIVIEANRSEKPDATVMCAVFGWEVDFGSVWLRDVRPSNFREAFFLVSEDKQARFSEVHREYVDKAKKKEAAKARAAAKKLAQAN